MIDDHAERIAEKPRLPLKVAELFAGVGGFRLGLERVKRGGESCFNVLWGNQWEPSTRSQHAFDIYEARFEKGTHSNADIATVSFAPDEVAAVKNGLALTPDMRAPDVDVLVGGFPCQDYSVARTLKQAQGILGKKGVLWWQIQRFLSEKKKRRPAFLILENVDRLLKSPAHQRGRDFAVLLTSLQDLGYDVEWRVINAADYGAPQRRRRVFIFASHRNSGVPLTRDPQQRVFDKGILAKAFPVERTEMLLAEQPIGFDDLALVSEGFNKGNARLAPFGNAGFFSEGRYWAAVVKPDYSGGRKTLGSVLIPEADVPSEFIIPTSDLKQWKYLKGAKSEPRTNKKTGFQYEYSEGPIAFPDPLEKPSRTIITGEGGRSPSRFKHVVCINGRYRRLTPIELERLNCFPDDHTATGKNGEPIPDGKRAFIMGNALVVDLVEKIGRTLVAEIFPSAPAKTRPVSYAREMSASH